MAFRNGSNRIEQGRAIELLEPRAKRIVAARRPAIRSHKPEEFVDTSFVAKLDKSGFIKKLYEQK
jgi:hypothetical protein